MSERTAERSDLFERAAVVGKAFASAKRLELLDLLSQGERTVDSIARETRIGLSTVSAHLQILKVSDLVHTRREGARIFYRLAGDDVATLYSAMRTVAQEHSAEVGRALDAYLGPAGTEAGVDQVSRDDLLAQLGDSRLVLLDVRPPEEYAAGHIPGARSVPFGDLLELGSAQLAAWAAAQADALAKPGEQEVNVVAYCRGAWFVMAHDAVRLLRSRGQAARRLEDGMLEWRTHGLPVEVPA